MAFGPDSNCILQKTSDIGTHSYNRAFASGPAISTVPLDEDGTHPRGPFCPMRFFVMHVTFCLWMIDVHFADNLCCFVSTNQTTKRQLLKRQAKTPETSATNQRPTFLITKTNRTARPTTTPSINRINFTDEKRVSKETLSRFSKQSDVRNPT